MKRNDGDLRGSAMLALADLLPASLFRRGRGGERGGIQSYLGNLPYPLPEEDKATIFQALASHPDSLENFQRYCERREDVQPVRGSSYFFIYIKSGRRSVARAMEIAPPRINGDVMLTNTAIHAILRKARAVSKASSPAA